MCSNVVSLLFRRIKELWFRCPCFSVTTRRSREVEANQWLLEKHASSKAGIKPCTTNSRDEQPGIHSVEELESEERKNHEAEHLLRGMRESLGHHEEVIHELRTRLNNTLQAEQKTKGENEVLSTRIGVLSAELEHQKAETVILMDDLEDLEAELKATRAQVNGSDECVVCFDELEGHPRRVVVSPDGGSAGGCELKKRAVFFPCMHATVCAPCALNVWGSETRQCPTCSKKLSRKPSRIHL